MSVIIDRKADKEIFSELERLNIPYYKSFDMKNLYQPVNTHPDMQIHFADKNYAIVAPSAFEYYKSILPEHIALQKGNADPGGTYPSDCAYNIAKIGKRIIGKLAVVDKRILEYYSNLNYEFIDVKQGYTKCNLCIVNDNSAITEDECIYKELTKSGLDVLKVPVGEIFLNGFEYGFIGGASGFVSDNTLAFFGDFSKKTYFKQIKEFIYSKRVDIILLSSIEASDFGSLLYF